MKTENRGISEMNEKSKEKETANVLDTYRTLAQDIEDTSDQLEPEWDEEVAAVFASRGKEIAEEVKEICEVLRRWYGSVSE